jgi:hypothetical protein
VAEKERFMAHVPPKTIKVTADSELGKLVDVARRQPVLLEKNGEVFLLERMETEEKTPSPEDVTRSRDGILKAAGSWKDIDTEAFKAYIAQRRRTANRPSIKL